MLFMTGSLIWRGDDIATYTNVEDMEEEAGKFLHLMTDDRTPYVVRCESCEQFLLKNEAKQTSEGEYLCDKCYRFYTKKFISVW